MSKKGKVLPIAQNYSKEELIFAAETSLRLVSQTSPKRATRIKKKWKSHTIHYIKYTPEEALALFVDGNFTKHTYILMQSGVKMRNADIYPSYDGILKAKKECCPRVESITISETSAEITVRALVDHTITRLATVQEKVLSQKIDDLSDGLTIIFKWGCDESSGHSAYKQKFSGDDVEEKRDSFIWGFQCTLALACK